MDSFSGRSSRPITSRETSAQRPSADPAPATAAPVSSRTSTTKPTKRKPRKLHWVFGGIITLALVGWFGWQVLNSFMVPGVKAGQYQAVFLTNGQVYFGKLSAGGADYYKLSEVYYLQASQKTAEDAKNPQQTSDANSDVQLIKLGNEIHGPEDNMVIAKSQVLFFENLKNDGKVSSTIKSYTEKNK